MAYNGALKSGYTLGDWLGAIFFGSRLDCSVAGYLTIIPFLISLVSAWIAGKWLKNVLKIYFGITALIIASIFTVDTALYEYWGFRIDASVLFYAKSPSAALASVSSIVVVLQFLIFVIYAFAIYKLFATLAVPLLPNKPATNRVATNLVCIVAGCTLFLPVRGSVSASTANVGMVYFSNERFLNHAAINPVFALMASIVDQENFDSQFNFFPENEREKIFSTITMQNVCKTDAKPELLKTKRPDILIVMLESFAAGAVAVTGGEPEVTPNLNRLSNEGILFTNMYANSFRTDRGIVAVLSGYLGQPTTSIMKYPAKTQSLPSISKTLVAKGYLADVLYGGDINFANMQSYFFSAGYSPVVSISNFPISDRLNRWGVNDDITFQYIYKSLVEGGRKSPQLSVFLTLSSHEPFEVPFKKINNPYLNSVAFTDHCIGQFIDSLKQTPVWENLLVIFVSDHGFGYPASLQNHEPDRFHIPMLWIGGAVKEPKRIETIACQTDLAATLFGQMDIDSREFMFSKDIFEPNAPKYAFYAFNNGFGFIDSTGVSVFDNESNSIVGNKSSGNDSLRIVKGKALLQTLYKDLAKR
jgi:phosphoglycerol transferase MdoB-like AlkP superfamily enzyme